MDMSRPHCPPCVLPVSTVSSQIKTKRHKDNLKEMADGGEETKIKPHQTEEPNVLFQEQIEEHQARPRLTVSVSFLEIKKILKNSFFVLPEERN